MHISSLVLIKDQHGLISDLCNGYQYPAYLLNRYTAALKGAKMEEK